MAKSSEIKPENLVTIERDIPNPYDDAASMR
jgi:hypothetical protein